MHAAVRMQYVCSISPWYTRVVVKAGKSFPPTRISRAVEGFGYCSEEKSLEFMLAVTRRFFFFFAVI